ncbi:MAG: tRNA 2-thiouridine synthesizing protein A [Pseudohongiellaceae bacterium]|jgi:tRNA 2-thiouridine synthesizing protein A
MPNPIQELDACGLQCPLPLLRAKQALNQLEDGQQLRVLATDAGSVRDFKAFTELSAHQLISSDEHEGVYIYVIEKH